MTLLRRLAVVVAVLILLVAQFLAWEDMDRQRADVEGQRAQLERQLSGERERVARLEGRLDGLETELASVQRHAREEEGQAREERARIEGQRDLLSEHLAGERTRTDQLQDELRAVERAAQAQLAGDVWHADDDVRLVGSRRIPREGDTEGLEIILQTTRERRPFGLEIECDCTVAATEMVPGSRFTGLVSANQAIREDKRAARLFLYDPAFTPYEALLVRIYSPERVILTRMELVPLAQIPARN